MRKSEAKKLADKINANPNGTDNRLESVIARVVRILPTDVDPVIEGDDGWDVEVKVIRDSDFFRDLNAAEITEFKAWARQNHKPGGKINPLWHTVIRRECQLIDAES
jgi:hypothetical protein